MKIRITSLPVDDQEKALQFYTQKLGFVKKLDIPMGEYRWLTLVSAEDQTGLELLLEPMGFAPAKTYQKALYDAGIPYTSFAVDDMAKEELRLKNAGVIFRSNPEQMGPVTVAMIEDGCGNLIQLVQQ